MLDLLDCWLEISPVFLIEFGDQYPDFEINYWNNMIAIIFESMIRSEIKNKLRVVRLQSRLGTD